MPDYVHAIQGYTSVAEILAEFAPPQEPEKSTAAAAQHPEQLANTALAVPDVPTDILSFVSEVKDEGKLFSEIRDLFAAAKRNPQLWAELLRLEHLLAIYVK